MTENVKSKQSFKPTTFKNIISFKMEKSLVVELGSQS